MSAVPAYKKHPRRGFTLIELMIVVSIIGILAAITVPKFADLVRKAKEGAVLGNLGALRGYLNIYYSATEGIVPGDIAATVLNVHGNIPSPQIIPYHRVFPGYSSINQDCSFTFGTSAPGIDSVINQIVTNWETVDQIHWVLVYCYYGSWNNQGPFKVIINCSHTDSKGTVWSSY